MRSRSLARPGPGLLLEAIREGEALTRADLGRLTGLGRATVAQRVDLLVQHGLVVEASDLPSTGGRPPTSLAFNAGSGIVLAADLGATHARFGVTDLAGRVLAERAEDLDIARGPASVLDTVADRLAELVDQAERELEDV